ncbi:glutamine synthetase, partial [Tremellales sp. Uapishka_1]
MPPSPTLNAPTNIEELKKLLENDTKVKVAGIDIDGVLRGKIMSKSKFLSAAKSNFNFCSVIFGWDIHDAAYTNELLVSNKANGYHDLIAVIDLSTYRRLTWEKNTAFFLCSFQDPDTMKPLQVDPRSVLEGVMSKATEKGWRCMSGVEFEYFQFKETPQSAAAKGFANLETLTPGSESFPHEPSSTFSDQLRAVHGYSMLRTTLNQDYFHALYDEAVAFGIDVEGHHTETGPGVFETALGYTDASRIADNAILFKLLAKSVGMKYGIIPTFMAKPHGDLPGCSGHIHVSLQDKDGKNIFGLSEEEEKSGGRSNAAFDDTKFISQEAEWFLGGLMEGLSDVVPLMCPTINSYKRLLGGEAMWAPDTSSFGYDSRAASIRIISAPGVSSSATRFEVRIPGADMNPFFALSAIFALGLRGIEKKTPLPYGPIGSKEVTRDILIKLPTSLEKATETFKASTSIAREILGDYFVDHFAGTREHELETHRRAVTSWEVERYLELI